MQNSSFLVKMDRAEIIQSQIGVNFGEKKTKLVGNC